MHLLSALRVLVSITIRSTSSSVYTAARRLSISVYCALFGQPGSDARMRACIEFEGSCWIDGMRRESEAEFFTCCTAAVQLKLHGALVLGRLRKGGFSLPRGCINPPCSNLLPLCLERVHKHSVDFVQALSQVLCRCLTFVDDPVLLASITLLYTAQSEENKGVPQISLLRQVASSLTSEGAEESEERTKTLTVAMSSLFSASSLPIRFLQLHSSPSATSVEGSPRTGKSKKEKKVARASALASAGESTASGRVNNDSDIALNGEECYFLFRLCQSAFAGTAELYRKSMSGLMIKALQVSTTTTGRCISI
jgi:hypothetical protein